MAETNTESKNGMVKNTVYSLSSKAVAMLLFMITDIIVARCLTYEDYGEWTYYYSIVSILYVVARLGINSSSQVFVASRVDKEEKKKYLVYGLRTRAVSSLIFGALLLIIMPQIAGLFGYPEKYSNIKNLFIYMPLLVVGNSMVDYFKSIFVGTSEFKKVFWLTIYEYFGIILLGASCVILTENVIYLNIGYVISYIIVTALGYRMMLTTVGKKIKSEEKKEKKEFVKNILKYAIPVMLTSFVSVLLMDMDTFMLGIMCPKGESGIYAIPKSLLTKATNFSLSISSSTMVAFAVVTHEEAKKKKKSFTKINLFNFGCVVAICVGFLLLGKIFIKILYGEKYIASVGILFTLLPYFLLFSLSVFPATYLNYQKLAHKSLTYNIIMFVCNLVLNLILIPKYGPMGAAIATSVSIVPYTVLLYISAYKDFKMKEKEGRKD